MREITSTRPTSAEYWQQEPPPAGTVTESLFDLPAPPRSEARIKPVRPAAERPLIKTPVPWMACDPPFRIARDKGFFGHESLHPTVLAHALALGGTGCGKSQSVVMPLMNAMLDYTLTDGTSMSLLVVDPKRELGPVLTNRISQQGGKRKLTVVGQCPPVRFFDEDVALSPGDKLAELRQLITPGRADPSHDYWVALANTMMTDLMRLEQDYRALCNKSLLATLLRKLYFVPAVPPRFWHRLQAVLSYSRSGTTELNHTACTLDTLLLAGGVRSPSANVFRSYTASSDLIEQWNYVNMSAESLVKALTDVDFTRAVDADPFPNIKVPHINIQRVVDRGRIVLFQPSNSPGDTVAARALKARFYAAVFSRQQMHRPVGIIMDEAHRFVSQDPSHGEQVLLDRCRSYRTNVVLATQSLRSLEHAMGSGSDAKDAVRILVANTPTRWLMRSSEPDAVELLRQLIPPPPTAGSHIADVRPPSHLKPGEAYWLLPDGRWGRGRAHLPSMN